MIETFPVPIRCPDCKGQLTALIGPINPTHKLASIWTCPYCRSAHRMQLGGPILWVTKRREAVTEPVTD